MLLFDDGYSASAAGDDHLICLRKGADGLKLHNVYGFGRCHCPPEALARIFYYIISFFQLRLRILRGHMASYDLGGVIEGLVVGIHGDLCQNGADGLVDSPFQKLAAESILDIIAHIALTHGGTDAHGGRRIVDIDSPQLRHGLMDHADLRAIAVGNGKLVVLFHQIGQSGGRDFHRVPLGVGGVA